MPLILSIETATTVCSVALHNQGVLIESSETLEPYSASSRLAVMIDEVLKKSKVQPSDLKAIAVSSGPGSYTGLRIGVATAKGLCFSLGIPLLSVNTLMAMVKKVQGNVDEGLLCPMIDARRMEVYCLLCDPEKGEIQATQAKIIEETSFKAELVKSKIFFFGNGAAKCKALIKHPHANFLDNINPSAEQVGEVAIEKFEKGNFEDTFDFEPRYLKEFLIKKPKSA